MYFISLNINESFKLVILNSMVVYCILIIQTLSKFIRLFHSVVHNSRELWIPALDFLEKITFRLFISGIFFTPSINSRLETKPSYSLYGNSCSAVPVPVFPAATGNQECGSQANTQTHPSTFTHPLPQTPVMGAKVRIFVDVFGFEQVCR